MTLITLSRNFQHVKGWWFWEKNKDKKIHRPLFNTGLPEMFDSMVTCWWGKYCWLLQGTLGSFREHFGNAGLCHGPPLMSSPGVLLLCGVISEGSFYLHDLFRITLCRASWHTVSTNFIHKIPTQDLLVGKWIKVQFGLSYLWWILGSPWPHGRSSDSLLSHSPLYWTACQLVLGTSKILDKHLLSKEIMCFTIVLTLMFND